jgi:hypothetical protein
VIDGRQIRRLEEIGSGLAQFIMTFISALIRRPSYILIDEPELGLHPSLQLSFLTRITSYTTEGGVIFATHNLGLARTGSDVLYSIRITDRGRDIRRFEETTSLSELLGELSYSGYRELGFNAVLLVEGVTDVKTYQQFLAKMKLDTRVVIVPLGGDQIISGKYENELSELRRLADRVYCVIDSEKTSADAQISALRLKFQQQCTDQDIACHISDRRATENYFPDAIVRAVKSTKYRALESFESLSDVDPAWGKSENWRLAAEMSLDELLTTDIGTFLATIAEAEKSGQGD